MSVADNANHLFVMEETEDFVDDAFDGFHVVLVGVEGFAEKLVNSLFRVSKSEAIVESTWVRMIFSTARRDQIFSVFANT